MEGLKEQFPIDDRVYSTVKMPVMQALPLHARVTKALGVGLGQGLKTLDKSMNIDQMGTAVLTALTQSDLEELVDMIPEVMKSVSINDQKLIEPHFSQHFGSYPQDVYPVFAWAVAVNISPFLGGSARGWNAFMTHLGLQSPKDGGRPGSSQDQSMKATLPGGSSRPRRPTK